MRFIIDAHLPKSLVKIFVDLGHEAIHTRELPAGNALMTAQSFYLQQMMVLWFQKMRTSTRSFFYMGNLHN
jgi:hypothetical protein